MVAGIFVQRWFEVSGTPLPLVGPVTLSSLVFHVPDLQADDWRHLSELALAITLILFAESYSAVRVFALKHGDATDANRELLALGAANLFAGLGHATPLGAGYSATAANEAAGAKSRLAGLVAGLTVALVAGSLLQFVALIPQAVLNDERVRIVILSLEETPDVDGTTIEALEQFAQRLLTTGRSLLLARRKTPVIDALARARLPALGSSTLSEESVATAVAIAMQMQNG